MIQLQAQIALTLITVLTDHDYIQHTMKLKSLPTGIGITFVSNAMAGMQF